MVVYPRPLTNDEVTVRDIDSNREALILRDDIRDTENPEDRGFLRAAEWWFGENPRDESGVTIIMEDNGRWGHYPIVPTEVRVAGSS